MNLEEIMEIDKKHFMPVYSGRYPLVIERVKESKFMAKTARCIMTFCPVSE